jgi:hypothetical protein
MELIHIVHERSKFIVHDFPSMAPSLLHKEIHPQRVVNVVEIHLFGIVKYLKEACCNEISVERETSIFPEEIIIAT